jgi:hypothetical protein
VSLANPFPYDEVHLGRAGSLLMVEVVGGFAVGMVLSRIGWNPDLAVVAMWLVNLVVAWFLAQAARALGRSALGYGLFSALAPFTAFYGWFKLTELAAEARLARRFEAGDAETPDRYVDADGIVHERTDESR